MTDITAIASILGSVKTATEIAKLLKDSDFTLEKAEMKLKLADLISALADARMETAEIQSLILEKNEKIQALEKTLETKAIVKYEKPSYWIGDDEDRDGPFCQHCYDKDGRLIRLQGNGEGWWGCKVCGSSYTDDDYEPLGGLSIPKTDGWQGF